MYIRRESVELCVRKEVRNLGLQRSGITKETRKGMRVDERKECGSVVQ